MHVTIRQADSADVGIVASLVHALLSELTPPEKEPPDLQVVRACTERVLNEGSGVWAFFAVDERGDAIGVLTLNECSAIYAGGKFGEISELYVSPHARAKEGLIYCEFGSHHILWIGLLVRSTSNLRSFDRDPARDEPP